MVERNTSPLATILEIMKMNIIVERLLYEEESDSLDFKREQYLFSRGSDDEKGELLKDILAFSNSWRRNKAYILIGIEEVKGGRSIVVGVEGHIDDAQLQQFVNSKTNRPITFSYVAKEIGGKQVAYIEIPEQNRPFYLKKDYGRLKKNVVYIRRGSSTSEALPDEMAEMGQAIIESNVKRPVLTPFLVNGRHNEVIEQHLYAKTILTEVPDPSEFPDHPYHPGAVSKGSGIIGLAANRNYYRELAKYRKAIDAVEGFSIGVRNDGNTVARDVVVTFDVLEQAEGFFVSRRDYLPKFPSKNASGFDRLIPYAVNDKPDVYIESISNGKRVKVYLGKIQAKDVAISNCQIFFGASKTSDLKLEVKVYSDDVEAPNEDVLTISFSVTKHVLGVGDFVKNN